jgi:hypothetical protein
VIPSKTPAGTAGVDPLSHSNDVVHDEAREGILRHGHVDAGDINVRVENGEVTLEGTVPSHRERDMAEADVRSLPGIKNVHNRLQVKHPQADLQSHTPSRLASVSGPVSEDSPETSDSSNSK